MIKAGYAQKNEIDRLFYDPELYDRITDDHCPPLKEANYSYDGLVIIGGYVKESIASLFIVHPDSKMHFMVLKEYRQYARELLKASFRIWPYKVYVIIPTMYRTVINFAKRNGFKEVERIPNDHLKNGVLCDSLKLIYEDVWAS